MQNILLELIRKTIIIAIALIAGCLLCWLMSFIKRRKADRELNALNPISTQATTTKVAEITDTIHRQMKTAGGWSHDTDF